MLGVRGFCITLALTSVVLAEESCGTISPEQMGDDVINLIQLQKAVSHSRRASNEKPDVDDLAKDATLIAEATMAFKKRLIERETSTLKFHEIQDWAEGKIKEGEADMKIVEKLESKARKASQKNEEAAKAVWKAALKAMKAAEDATSKDAKEVEKIMSNAEKHANDVLTQHFKDHAASYIKEHIATRKKFENIATKKAAEYVAAYNKTVREISAKNKKKVEPQAISETMAEGDILLSKALHENLMQFEAQQTRYPSSAVEEEHTLDETKLDKKGGHSGPEYKALKTAIEAKIAAHSKKKPLEIAAEIADATRTALYGDVSERAVQLAASKITYKMRLLESEMSAGRFKWYKDWAQDKIDDGKASLKRNEAKHRADAEKIQLKVDQARAKWEALTPQMLEMHGASDADDLMKAAEKIAEKAMNKKLASKWSDEIDEKVWTLSDKTHAYEHKETKHDHTTEKKIAKKAAEDFQALASKVDKKLASEEKLLKAELSD